MVPELNLFVLEQYRIDLGQHFEQTRLTFDEAAELYPEWVAALKDEKPRGYWSVNRNLYEWSKRKIEGEAKYGHRYFCLMLLAMCGAKCSFYDEKKNPNPVTFEEVKRDAESLREKLDKVKPEYPMSDSDISSALECFDTSFVLFPRETIERLTAIPMPQQKRNYRKQAIHMRIMSATRDILYPNGEWRNTKGKPTKQALVITYLKAHPNANNSEASRDLGIDVKTVRKWRKTMQE